MTARTLSISTVWDRTTDFLSGHWRPAALISIATISVNDALAAILQPIMRGEAEPGTRIAAFAAILVGTLWSITGQLALTAFVFDPARTTGQAMRKGTARLPPMIGGTLLVAVAATIAAAPLVAGILLQMIDLQAEPPVLPGWFLLYAVFFSLLVVAAWARLVLMAPSIVEGLGPVAAIRSSLRRTQGHFWKLVGAALLYLVVSGVVTLALSSAAGAMFAMLLGDAGRYAGAIVTGIATGLISMAALIFIAKLHHALTPAESGT